jgi:hypothetical protein
LLPDFIGEEGFIRCGWFLEDRGRVLDLDESVFQFLLDLINFSAVKLHDFSIIGGNIVLSIPLEGNFFGDDVDLIVMIRESEEDRGSVGGSIDDIGVLVVDDEHAPLRFGPCYFLKLFKSLDNSFSFFLDPLSDELNHDFSVGFAGELTVLEIFLLDLGMVADDAIVHCVEPASLVEVRVGVVGGLAAAGRPPGMGNAHCADASLFQNLIDHSVDAILIALSFIGVSDEFAVGHSPGKTVDSSTIIASVFEQIHSVAEKVFNGDSGLGVLFGFFFGNSFLRDDSDDATAFNILFRHEEVA